MLVEVLPSQRPQARATLETIRHMEELPATSRGPAWLQLSLMDKVRARPRPAPRLIAHQLTGPRFD